MVMPGRNWAITGDTKYRYAYNGMEQDPEVSGTSNSYTTEFRQYDPRLGRWKSLHLLMAQFPWQSPYCAFDNNPVYYVDLNGLSSQGSGDSEGGEDPLVTYRIIVPDGNGGTELANEYNHDYVNLIKTGEKYKATEKTTVVRVYNNKGKLISEVVSESKMISNNGGKTAKASAAPELTPLSTPTPKPRMTVIRGKPVSPASTPWYVGAMQKLTLTAGFVFMDHGGYNPESQYFQYPDANVARDIEERDKEFITLYRGVGESAHPAMYRMAQKGTAVPKGLLSPSNIHSDPDDHTMGDNYTLWTSWSLDKRTATNFAKGPMGTSNGVVLTITVRRSEVIQSDLSKALFSNEAEYLLFGIQKAHQVEPVTGGL